MAVKEWAPEREVSPVLARALIAEQFPRLRPARVERFGQGWDNSVFLADGAWVFRFPRRQIAVPLLEMELRVLPAIAPRLPLAVPVPELAGAPSERFPWPFAGYRVLAGRTADRAGLTDAQRIGAAEVLGNFLRVLHGLEPPIELGGDRIGRADGQRMVRIVRGRLGELGLSEPDWLEAPVRAARESALVHGDLAHARNLLVDEAGRPCGVIDWGDVHRGDRAVDLAIAPALLPKGAHAAFRAAYGSIEDDTWRLARLRALHTSAALAVYARDLADVSLLQEALSGIERTRAA